MTALIQWIYNPVRFEFSYMEWPFSGRHQQTAIFYKCDIPSQLVGPPNEVLNIRLHYFAQIHPNELSIWPANGDTPIGLCTKAFNQEFNRELRNLGLKLDPKLTFAYTSPPTVVISDHPANMTELTVQTIQTQVEMCAKIFANLHQNTATINHTLKALGFTV